MAKKMTEELINIDQNLTPYCKQILKVFKSLETLLLHTKIGKNHVQGGFSNGSTNEQVST